MSKKKLNNITLVISEIFPPRVGGSGRWLFEVYKRWSAGVVHVVTGEHVKGDLFDRQCSISISRMPLSMTQWGMLSFKGIRDYLGLFQDLKQTIKNNQITEIHVARCLPEGWLALMLSKWTGLKYSVYVHGEDIEAASESRELSWMTQRILNNAGVVIANSNNSAEILRSVWNQSNHKVKVVHPGVDTQYYTPAERDAQTRKQLNWDNRKVILTVGRLQKRKGHDKCVEAIALLREDMPELLYAIVGGGEERQGLEKKVLELGLTEHVKFYDEISDDNLLSCYQQCDLFILPNRTVGRDIEGFGMVLVEAQACGKAVIAGDSGGTVDTMVINETGRIIDCTRPEIIAENLSEMFTQNGLLKDMGSKARAHVVERFDWTVVASKVQKELMEMRDK